MSNRHELLLPDLGLGSEPVTLSVWLVRTGDAVIQGDRIVELLASNATVDLPAPVSGVLVRKLVREEDQVHTGQPLAVIASEEE